MYRKLLHSIALLTLFSLLYSQAARAAEACLAVDAGGAPMSHMAVNGNTPCHKSDNGDANLHYAQCAEASQAFNSHAPHTLAAAAPVLALPGLSAPAPLGQQAYPIKQPCFPSLPPAAFILYGNFRS